jgi:tetratricopeptide (TPR) repeat protein
MPCHKLCQSTATRLVLVALSAAGLLCPTTVHAQADVFTSSHQGHTQNDVTNYDQGARRFLNGHVVNQNGQPVTDVLIELRSVAGKIISSVTADRSGSFYIPNLDPGWYEVVATSGINRSVTTVDVSSFPEPLTIRLGSAPSAVHNEATVSVNSLATPSDAQKAFEAAERLFQKNDLSGAWNKVNKALQAWPNYAAALTLRGVLKMGNNQPQPAIDDFAAAVEADRSYHLAYIGLAAAYNLSARFDEALRALDQVDPRNPQSWQIHFETSKALLGKKSFGRALQEADRAASLLGRDLPEINVLRANAYIGMQDMNSAAKELREYLRLDGSGPLADKARALLVQMGR